MPEGTGVSFYLRSCRPQRNPMIKVTMDNVHIPKTDINFTVLYIALIAPEIFCKLPSSQTAIMGMPKGLTRKASVNRISPFCTEYVTRTARARTARMPLTTRNRIAEQEISPTQIHVSRSRTSATGITAIFNMVFIQGCVKFNRIHSVILPPFQFCGVYKDRHARVEL